MKLLDLRLVRTLAQKWAPGGVGISGAEHLALMTTLAEQTDEDIALYEKLVSVAQQSGIAALAAEAAKDAQAAADASAKVTAAVTAANSNP